MVPIKNRRVAGQQLAKKLKEGRWSNTLVLALPRGGVPVAAEVAAELKLPWDVLLVKKVTAQKNSELAIGAVSEYEEPIWNDEGVSFLKLTPPQLKGSIERTRQRIKEQSRKWRQGRERLPVQGRTVVVVDDGMATGLTMLAAVEFLIRGKARKIVVAVPVASESAKDLLSKKADRTVVVHTPEPFVSVSQWYEDFTQTTDEEVTTLLARESAETLLSDAVL